METQTPLSPAAHGWQSGAAAELMGQFAVPNSYSARRNYARTENTSPWRLKLYLQGWLAMIWCRGAACKRVEHHAAKAGTWYWLVHSFHSLCQDSSIPFHSMVPSFPSFLSIPFHSIPFHWFPFHCPFHFHVFVQPPSWWWTTCFIIYSPGIPFHTKSLQTTGIPKILHSTT